MKIGVIGGGSIGLLISRYLHKKHQITLYVRRNEQKEKLLRQGLILDSRPPVYGMKVALLEDIKKEDLFIICVKQYHLKHILPYITSTRNQASLLFLQNGMGHIKAIKSLSQPLYIGVVEHGASRRDDHIVSHTGKGKIKLASYNVDHRECLSMAHQLHQCDFPFETVTDWYEMLVEKLTVNAVINPVTALLNIKNGEILQNTYIKKMAYDLCKETSDILGLDADEQWGKVERIILNTSRNTSSMLTDMIQNRSTEIDSISGYLSHLSHHQAPLTTFVYYSIKALEMKKGIST